MMRAAAMTAAAGLGFAVLIPVVAAATTDGYGCENGCGVYERAVMNVFPIAFWAALAVAVGAVLGWLWLRRTL